MSDTKPCGNCGHPLDKTEQHGLHEFAGKMWSSTVNENVKIIKRETVIDLRDSYLKICRDNDGFEPLPTPIEYMDAVIKELK